MSPEAILTDSLASETKKRYKVVFFAKKQDEGYYSEHKTLATLLSKSSFPYIVARPAAIP